ncbi:MAG TPA: hypothetical protein EYN66_07630 [Myxococcales bacterium]|nr:hypothetical protein [Myxococcales bacterium]
MTSTGSNRAHFTAKDVILNADLNYLLGVCDLNVDCTGLGIFPSNFTNDVFRIRRRVVPGFPQAGTAHPVFLLNPNNPARQFNDSLGFMAQLAYWGEQFSFEQNALAVLGGPHPVPANTLSGAGRKYLQIAYDVGGRINITGASEFWNNFIVEVTPWAAKVLQLTDYVVSVPGTNYSAISLTTIVKDFTDVVVHTGLFGFKRKTG